MHDHIFIEPQPSAEELGQQVPNRSEASNGPYDVIDLRFHFKGKVDEPAFIAFVESLATWNSEKEEAFPIQRAEFISKQRISMSFISFIFAAQKLFSRIVARRLVHRWWSRMEERTKCKAKWRKKKSQERPLEEWLAKLQDGRADATSSEQTSKKLPRTPNRCRTTGKVRSQHVQTVAAAHTFRQSVSPLNISQTNQLLTPIDTDDQLSMTSSMSISARISRAQPTQAVLQTVARKKRRSVNGVEDEHDSSWAAAMQRDDDHVSKRLRSSTTTSK